MESKRKQGSWEDLRGLLCFPGTGEHHPMCACVGLDFGAGNGTDTHGAQKELLACTRYQVQLQQASKQTTEVSNIDAYVTRLWAVIYK